MELQLEKLHLETNIEIYNNDLLHVYKFSGEFTSVDALLMKNEWQSSTPKQMLFDLSEVSQTDLIAINALVAAHRRHQLSVILPLSTTAQQVFRLTKFDSIFNIKNNTHSYVEVTNA
jgi:anti-anti-sigma regulatory factor